VKVKMQEKEEEGKVGMAFGDCYLTIEREKQG